MSFDVHITRQALDGLPPDLPGEAFDALVELLAGRLAVDPLERSQRIVHPTVVRPTSVFREGFECRGKFYTFAAYFWFRPGDSLVIWDLQIRVDSV
jgi:hypothetical protein